MPPSGFNIGALQIRFYGIIIAFAMLVGVMLACLLAKKRNVKSDDIILLATIVLPLSVIGARLYYCIFYEAHYTFVDFFKIWEGGLAIYGGVIGGLVGVIIFGLIKKDFKLIAVICDICVPCLILGQAIGRWGNFFNQEAYGNLVTNPNLQWFPYAVFIEAENAWFQATFFYECLWNLVGFAILTVVFLRVKITGITTASYMIWYGTGRMWIEGLRSDSLYLGSSGIRVSQLLSGILVAIGVVIIVYQIVKHIRRGNGQKV